MKKYKLINHISKEEYLCDKITLDDGFDYYVSDEKPKSGEYSIAYGEKLHKVIEDIKGDMFKKLIATNNPYIEFSKVVDLVERLSLEKTSEIIDLNYNTQEHKEKNKTTITSLLFNGSSLYKEGYNKSKETYKFTGEDMIEFLHWVDGNFLWNDIDSFEHFEKHTFHTKKELLQLWSEKYRVETIYFK